MKVWVWKMVIGEKENRRNLEAVYKNIQTDSDGGLFRTSVLKWIYGLGRCSVRSICLASALTEFNPQNSHEKCQARWSTVAIGGAPLRSVEHPCDQWSTLAIGGAPLWSVEHLRDQWSTFVISGAPLWLVEHPCDLCAVEAEAGGRNLRDNAWGCPLTLAEIIPHTYTHEHICIHTI